MSDRTSRRSHTLSLGWLFLRARPVRLGAFVVACVAFLVVGLVLVTEALQTSGKQLAAQELGASDYTLRPDGAEVPLGTDGSDVNGNLISAMQKAGATQAEVGYAIFGVTPDGHPEISLNIFERKWKLNPFPERFTLLEGRIPRAPGELAVSPTIAESIPHGSSATFFDGELRSRVVGVVLDNFARSSSFVLASPGSWDSMGDMPPGEASRFGVSAARELFWNGEATPTAIVQEVVPLLISDIDHRASAIEAWPSIAASKLETEAHSPPLFTELLLLLMFGPLAASLFSGWFSVRFLNRVRATMLTVGVHRTKLPGLTAVLISTVVSACLGSLLGVAAGTGLRPLIDLISNSVLGPVHNLFAICTAVVATATVGASLSLVLLKKPTRAVAKGESQLMVRRIIHALPRLGQLLPVVIVALAVAGVLFARAGTTNEQFLSLYCFGLAVVAMTPYVLRLVMKTKTGNLAISLGLRRIAAEFRFSAWAMVVLSALLMVSFALSTIYFSSTQSQNAQAEANTPPDQIYFRPALDVGPMTESLRSEIEQYVGVSDAILFSRAIGATTQRVGATLVFDSIDDVERATGLKLAPGHRRILTDGGTLRTKPPDLSHVTFENASGGRFEMPSTRLSGLDASFNAYDGFILRSTAENHGVALAVPTWAYTDADSHQLKLASEAPEALGFNSDWLQVYEAPPLATEPIEFSMIALVIAGIGGVVMAYYAASAAKALRPNLAAVRSLGMRRRWLITTLAVQVGTILIVAIGIAAISAILATATALALWLPGVSLHVPWKSLSVLILTMLVVVTIALTNSSRNLSMIERFGSR